MPSRRVFYMHEVTPKVVAMAVRILTTGCITIFQVSLFIKLISSFSFFISFISFISHL